MYLSLTTSGISIATEGDLTISSPDSMISAFSARIKHVARRADTTLNGSKLAFSTSTFLIAYALTFRRIIRLLFDASDHTTPNIPPHLVAEEGDRLTRTALRPEIRDSPGPEAEETGNDGTTLEERAAASDGRQ